MFRTPHQLSAAFFAIACASVVFATGQATCDSGEKTKWQPQEKLEKMLTDKGWQIRRVKEDGGCYEVYALDKEGKRVEIYFHPVTLEHVPTRRTPTFEK